MNWTMKRDCKSIYLFFLVFLSFVPDIIQSSLTPFNRCSIESEEVIWDEKCKFPSNFPRKEGNGMTSENWQLVHLPISFPSHAMSSPSPARINNLRYQEKEKKRVTLNNAPGLRKCSTLANCGATTLFLVCAHEARSGIWRLAKALAWGKSARKMASRKTTTTTPDKRHWAPNHVPRELVCFVCFLGFVGFFEVFLVCANEKPSRHVFVWLCH